MAYDFKKEMKDIYRPGTKPALVKVPSATFIAVRGHGDPNDEDGEYKRSIPLLYGIAYAVKMSKKGGHRIPGYFDFVVPPLEGLWWQPGVNGMDYARKDGLEFFSLIRMPDFVTEEEFAWAKAEAACKKEGDFGRVELVRIDEGFCVQCMHLGPYDDEPETVARMHEFAKSQGCAPDLSDERRHHEVYLGDPRKTAPDKLKTVVRHPVRPIESYSVTAAVPSLGPATSKSSLG